jgi:hypothetical protein
MAKGRERKQKWYLKNEVEVMTDLGLKPAKGSGNGWIEKEDGENDYVLAQLKSTDKQSYKLNQLDIKRLEYNAMVAKKIPMFVLQFLNDDSRYALVAIEDLPDIAEYIKTGNVVQAREEPILDLEDKPKKRKSKPVIKSSASAREEYFAQKQKEWEERKYK